MFASTFGELNDFGGTALAALYLLIFLGVAYASFRLLGKESWGKFQSSFRFAALIFFEVASIELVVLSDWDFAGGLFMLIALLTSGAIHFLKLDRQNMAYRLNELALILITAGLFTSGADDVVSKVLLIVDTVVIFTFFIEHIRILAAKMARVSRDSETPKPKTGIELAYAIAVNLLFLSAINNMTDWFDRAYPFSLACMFIALVIISLGFWSRAKALRLYGLTVVIVCVLKLVTYDIMDLDTIMRVVAFIGGGIICFGISALYNFAVKRFESDTEKA
jgi:uncharacterized membrane protein